MIEDRQLDLNEDLRLEVTVVVENIKKFFSDNNIGPEQGGDLVHGFLSHTFNGGSTVVDSESSAQTSEQANAWLNQMEMVIKNELINQSDLTKGPIFSPTPDIHGYLELLREAFWEAIFSFQPTKTEIVDGTAQVIACLLILKIHLPQCSLCQLTATKTN